MAGELVISINFAFSKEVSEIVRQISRNANGILIDITGDKYVSNVQEIGTSAEDLELGDITSPGYMLIHNLDNTNFIEVGYDDSGFKPTVKVPPGEWGVFALAQATPQGRANTAACDAEYIVVEV
jgi:hypothetical protein